MAFAAPHNCIPGCPELVPHGRARCPGHTRSTAAIDRQVRGSAHERGYSAKWRKARLEFLQKNPICRECRLETPPRIVAATVVDHVVPHKGDLKLFWDRKNWQPLCAPHHNRKTAREDGGFGRAVR